ncbi:MAG: ClpXP protease specificity-enhancing factor [Betaproteobacteria bacterium]|nr:ClpXP protease specificity-enhancing factor [Pseudomonadota bacterium]NBO04197.1 ClpXP protease specificity-enhancing factor [Betaproteobacteria bacterium]NBO94484.1 ClpXP protease specificity-enhancing factor [Betaproteobacteria bacterium]NBP34268.1 ClpXP protease specificity-enhancing factor [Betaproteobacteria bacterium]NBP38349.1 ClpXP protease specificity-enhancing factor [Betaproteobacteria bacterium]
MNKHSTKPYLIRAIHEWCSDQGHTPYLAVAVDEHTHVPLEYVKAGEIVLNVSLAATNRLRLGNDWIEFQARFGGIARDISIPISNVSAIYARETGHGMAFEVSKAPAHLEVHDAAQAPPALPSPKPTGPQGASVSSLALASSQRAPSKEGQASTGKAPVESAKRMRSVGPRRQPQKAPSQSQEALAAQAPDSKAQLSPDLEATGSASTAQHPEGLAPEKRDASAALSASKRPVAALSSVDKQSVQDDEAPTTEGSPATRARGAARGASKSRPKLTRVK